MQEIPTDAPVGRIFRRALQAVIEVSADDRALPDSTFSALGGDSIDAVTLSALLESEWGLRLPVPLILDRTSTVADLVRHLEGADAMAATSHPSVTSVHGDSAELRADDFSIERWLPAREMNEGASRAGGRAGRETRAVLLTGANGFLGRFILLDLLARGPEEIAKVACLVRARDDAGARARLAASFATDPDLLCRFEELARGGRLSVFACDLLRPGLGLSRATFDALAGEVDALVHAGALVNHALPYDALFEPNVLGTVEVARLALQGRPKSLTFVSTVALAEGLARTTPLLESEAARALWPARDRFSGAPGHGYTTSKWACELLLDQLCERDRVPVTIFRCSNLMAHARYRGQINADDFLCRLLSGIVYTGVAPASFYENAERPACFDGVPVEFAAGAIADLAFLNGGAPRPRRFHLIAPEQPRRVSLDSMRDTVEAHGYPLVRVADHAAWYRAFVDRLERLGGDRRRHSPLRIMARWRDPLRGAARPDSSVFQGALAEIRAGADATVPALTPSYLHKYLDDLQFLGVI